MARNISPVTPQTIERNTRPPSNGKTRHNIEQSEQKIRICEITRHGAGGGVRRQQSADRPEETSQYQTCQRTYRPK